MSYKVNSFYYYVQDLSEYFESFVERLMTHLAMEGTAISDKEISEDFARMKVRYMDERGTLVAAPVDRDIKVVYEVEGGGIVRKSLWGAITGGGLASLASGLLGGDIDSIKSALTGAVVGGAYGLKDGFETAMEDATNFSRLLAHAIRSVEEELRQIKRGKEAAIEERRREEKELKERLEEIYAEAVTVGEEIDLLDSEGKDVAKARARYEKALEFLDEADDALKRSKEMLAKAKIRSAERMVQLAREELAKVG